MDQERREHYRKVLLDLRMDLTSELQKNSNGVRDRDSNDTMDSVDLANSSYSSDTNLTRVEALNLRIREIDDSLERIRNGTYGVCGVCGEDIPDGRLQVRPIARYCAQCKEDLEKRGEIK